MPDTDSIHQRVEDLLDEWEFRRAEGEELTAEEICCHDPDCLDDVRNAISRLRRIDRFLGTDVGLHLEEALSDFGAGIPPVIGDCRIIEEIARGGSAIVYRARQESLSRNVAVKLIRVSDRPHHTLKRFERETQALAMLNNRFITGVFDAGIVDLGLGSQPYLVMEFIDGQPLDLFLQHSHLALPDRLELFLKICEGVQFAHDKGVIHRDLKPSNILVTHDGNPHVCDFGIARILDPENEDTTEHALTQSSEIIGTLQYMSPEHITGPHHLIDAQADVYSLGMVLYELVTGSRPYETREQTVFQAIETVREMTAPPIRQADSTLHRDLETIVARAVEKNRADRYLTVTALASDITSYLSDRPIQARRVAWPELTIRWCRRNRAVAVSLCVMFLSLLSGLAVSMYYGAIANANASRAAKNEKESLRLATVAQDRLKLLNAEIKESETQRILTRASEARSRKSAFNSLLGNIQKMSHSDPHLARQWLDDPDRCPTEWRHFSWRMLRHCADRTTVELLGHEGGTTCVSFSRAGTILASVGHDGGLRIWDLPSRTLKCEYPDAGLTRRTVISPNGQMVLGLTESGLMKIIALADGQLISERSPQAAEVLSVGWLESNDGVLLGTRDGTVEIWPLDSGSPRQILEAGTTGIAWVKPASPDEIASVSISGEFRITRLSDRFLLRNDNLPGARQLKRVTFASGGRLIAVAPTAGFVHSYELPGALTVRTTVIRERVFGLKSTDFPTKYLAACRRRIRILVPGEGEVGTQRHEFHTVTAFDFSRPTNLAAISGDTGTIWLMEIGDRAAWKDRVNHSSPVTASACLPDKDVFITTDQSGRAILSRGGSGEFLSELMIPEIAPIRAVSVRDDGRQLALAGSNGVALVRVERQRLELEKILSAGSTIFDVDYSPDRTLIAGAGRNGVITVWNATSHARLFEFHHDSPAISLKFRPRSAELLVGHRLGQISVWSLESGKRISNWTVHVGKVNELRVTRDGSRLFSAGGDERICCWDLETKRLIQTLVGHRAPVSSLALSPDGKTLASGGHDRQLLFWDAETGELQLQFPLAHGDWISSLTFSANGKKLVSTGLNDIHTRVWHSPDAREPDTSQIR